MSSKPWRDQARRSEQSTKKVGSALETRRAGPLVSTGVLSAPTQRNTITALFTLLQVLKLSSDKTFFKFLTFTALDLAFVWFLPVLAIPGLNFKKNVIVAFVALLALGNYSVFISSYWLVLLIGLALRPVEWILGFNASRHAVKGRGLISGRYVVDILPEASASLDTIAPLCIAQSNTPVYLRLNVNATWPSSVRLSRGELGNSEEYDTFEYTKRALSKLPSQPELQTLYLPVSTPGAYYLDGITDDRTGLRVRIQRNRIVIPPCPDVEITALGDSTVCVGSDFEAEITASGVPPLNVFVDHNWVTLGSEGSDNDAAVTLKHKLSKPGLHVGDLNFEVTKVRDKFGSVLNLEGSTKSVSGKIIALPSASVAPRKYPLVNGKASVEITSGGSDIPNTVTLDGPEGAFEVVLSTAGTHAFSVTKPGTYSLKGVAGIHCSNEASGSFEVFTPPPVDMSVDFESVEDKCAGPTGMDAQLKLSGTAPFKVVYRSLQGSSLVNQKTAEFRDSRGVVQFRPKDAGEFMYEFVSVEDRYGKIALSGDDYRRYQRIAELPGAQFGPMVTQKLCGQSHLSLDVLVRGKWPLIVKYSVDDKEEATLMADETTESSKIPLDLNFESGTHFVRLLTLTDRNGCVTDLRGLRTADIIVRKTLPKAAWAHPGERKSAEPVNEELPLNTESLTYPATVEYEHRLKGVVSRNKVTLRSEKDAVLVNKPGTYKLVGLSDSVCNGEVTDSEVEIGLYERPRLHLVTEPVPSMCHASSLNVLPSKANIIVVGEAPYTVLHEVVDPRGQSHTKEIKIRNPELSLDLDNSLVGEYHHYLWVMDSRYGDFDNSQRSLTFIHRVWAPAEASFVSPNAKVPTCQGDMLSQNVPVALKGQPPFQLTLKAGKQTKVVNATSHSLLDLRRELGEFGEGSGSRQLRILDVTDAHGCRTIPTKYSGEVTIEVLPKPLVQKPKKMDYCIGEKVQFPIKGHGNSFDVEYAWRGKKHRAISHGMFEKYANAPGNMSIISVADEQGCRSMESASVEVHSLPSSSITEESHFSIYRGESIGLGFSFTGTPPFSFVYTRSVNGALQERKEVKNVMENTYSITVEDGGEYEIVELRDKYCRSER